MQSSKTISSSKNPFVKQILLLKEKSRERKKTGLFVIEGLRELTLAQKGSYDIVSLLLCEELFTGDPSLHVDAKSVTLVTKAVYQKVAHRDSTEGILAIAKTKAHHLDEIRFATKTPLILVAEAPEKPGNIGALLRTADAAKLDAVLIANPKTDLYNPNIIRSSVGCVFTTQIGMGSTADIIGFLKTKKIAIYCAALTASKNYLKLDYTKATALVVGTESTGLSSIWLNNAHHNLIIPMEGEIDSMNVSVSAAILIFEAKRQRYL